MYVSHTQHYNLTLYYTVCSPRKVQLPSITILLIPFPISSLHFTSPIPLQESPICSYIYVFVHLFWPFFIPHLSENTQYLSLTSFTWHNILKVHPYCHNLQDLILFMAKQYCIVYLYSKSSTVEVLFHECIGKSSLFTSPTKLVCVPKSYNQLCNIVL